MTINMVVLNTAWGRVDVCRCKDCRYHMPELHRKYLRQCARNRKARRGWK